MLDVSGLMEAVGGSFSPKGSECDGAFVPGADVPIEITDGEAWANYTNDALYEMDSKVREFLKKTTYRREKHGGYRTTASLVFAWIYGRRAEPADSARCRMLNELLKYYCTSYTGATTFMGKKVPRVYEFSKYSCKSKRPYSLRLRLEEADEGKNPWRNGPGYRDDKRRHGRRGDREDVGEADA